MCLSERVIRAGTDLAGLDDWLAVHARDISWLSDDDAAARIAGLIDVSVAEFDDDLIDACEVRRRVAGFLESLHGHLGAELRRTP